MSNNTFYVSSSQFLVMTLHDRSFKSRTAASSSIDPFERSQLTPSHIVTPIAPLHTLILNKYYTIQEHSILITNNFERQESLLTIADIEAWFFCISSIKALGFYNSNPQAGASQPHKHMQLIPLNEIRNLSPASTYTLPIDMTIRPKIIRKEWKYFLPFSTTNGRVNGNYRGGDRDGLPLPDEILGASQDNVYRIPEYQFKHAIVALISSEDWLEVTESISYSEYLVASYRQLLRELDLITSLTSRAGVATGAYNVLLTDRWMLLVCRRQDTFYYSPSTNTNSGSGSGSGSDGGDGGSSGSGSFLLRGVTAEADEEAEAGGVEGGAEVEVASVNGLGFAGLVLARSPAARSVIRDLSPLAVLRGVSLGEEDLR
jgi:ATP adenylyltransferase/5',5'''-P-1,P-4-tetraphosphate phosphorylase II